MKYVIGIAAIAGALFMAVPGGLSSGWGCVAPGAVWPVRIGPPSRRRAPCWNDREPG